MKDTDEQVRIVLILPGSKNILVSGRRGAFALPSVRIPAHSRPAEEITAALLRLHNVDTYCLFTFPCDSRPLVAHHYSFSCLSKKDSFLLPEFHWADQSSLRRGDCEDECDFAALQTGYELVHKCQRDPKAGYFARPGWLDEITDWTRRQLARQKLPLPASCVQLNASATTSLLRFETGASGVWFKAVGEPNLREFPITLYLAQYFPEFVPAIVATHEKSNGWLTTEVPGSHLSADSADSTWLAVADALAEFQRRTVGHTLHLTAAGCIDLRSHALAELVAPFLEVMAELMDEQTKTCPAPLNREELKSLESILLDAISSADALDLPSALVHLDFNLGNIIAGADRVTFIDWAAGAVGFPFLTCEYLLEQLRTLRPTDDALRTQVRNVYAEKWRSLLDEDAFSEAVAVAPLLAAFGYATSGGAWSDPARRSNPATAGHLRSMTRRMKREAEPWVAGSKARAAFPQLR